MRARAASGGGGGRRSAGGAPETHSPGDTYQGRRHCPADQSLMGRRRPALPPPPRPRARRRGRPRRLPPQPKQELRAGLSLLFWASAPHPASTSAAATVHTGASPASAYHRWIKSWNKVTNGSSSRRLSVRLPAQHEHGCAQRRRRPMLEPTGGSGTCPAHVPSHSLSARISPSRIGKCCCAASIASYPGMTRHRRRWTEITDTRRGRVCREGVHAEAHLPAACAQLAVAAQQPPQVVAGAGTSLHPAAARRHPAGATVQRRSPHLDPERRHSPRRREEPRRRAHLSSAGSSAGLG